MIILPPGECEFPDPNLADTEGLVALCGELSPNQVLKAYGKGIFPWYSENEPVMWWSPNPRMVLFPEEFKIPRSLRPKLNKPTFHCTFDQSFEQVIEYCRMPRPDQQGTWITDEMKNVYVALHESGYAHSLEVWLDKKLVAGLYGVSLGKMFAGESMFTLVSDASKIALVKLVEFCNEQGFHFMDCQVFTEHLARFGAIEIPRQQFLGRLEKALGAPTIIGKWSLEKS